MLRCEKGEVKKLAEKKIWPFTEYAEWNRFRLELPTDYPLKPPVATWLSDVSHPNIVPNIPNAVCVSVLGENWRPDLKIISVVNSLYYLLSDPNPQNVFDHPRCLKAANVCRNHGFPKMNNKQATKPTDLVHFNIVPVPAPAPTPTPIIRREQASDIIRFRIPGREGR